MQYNGWAAQLNLDYPTVNDPNHPGGTNYFQLGDNFVQGPNGLAADNFSVVPEPGVIPILLTMLGGWLGSES